MDYPVNIGECRYATSPQEPRALPLVRTPCRPGLSLKDQHRAGRAELFTTPFAIFDDQIRDQLGRIFSAGGFDPARDIQAIAVNRWPHGYAPGCSTPWDPEWPPGNRPTGLAGSASGASRSRTRIPAGRPKRPSRWRKRFAPAARSWKSPESRSRSRAAGPPR
jgi:hypothetical protein